MPIDIHDYPRKILIDGAELCGGRVIRSLPDSIEFDIPVGSYEKWLTFMYLIHGVAVSFNLKYECCGSNFQIHGFKG